MKVKITKTIEVDTIKWRLEYGMESETEFAVQRDIQDYFGDLVSEAVDSQIKRLGLPPLAAMPKSATERSRARRARLRAEGKVQFGPEWVRPELKAKLKKMVEDDENPKSTDSETSARRRSNHAKGSV